MSPRLIFWQTLSIAAFPLVCHAGAAYYPMQKSFQYSPSVQVAYDVAGSGPRTLVMVHGLAASKETWDLVAPGLLDQCDCRILRVDLRGHGDTSKPDDHAYTLGENVSIVRGLMAHEHVRGAMLIGHSYGGAVALQLALQAKNDDPGLVRALVLMSTPGVKQKFPWIVAQQRYAFSGAIIDRVTTPKGRARIALMAGYHNKSQVTEDRIDLYARLWSSPAGNRAARETGRVFMDEGLKSIAAEDHSTGIPTLVIGGHDDRLVRIKHQRELASTIPGAHFEVIHHCGHVPQEDTPNRVVHLLGEFIHSAPVSTGHSL